MTFHLTPELIERVKNAVVALSGPPVHQTVTAFGRAAAERELVRLQKKYNRGKPFPPRSPEAAARLAAGGRPVKG